MHTYQHSFVTRFHWNANFEEVLTNHMGCEVLVHKASGAIISNDSHEELFWCSFADGSAPCEAGFTIKDNRIVTARLYSGDEGENMSLRG